MPTPARDCGVGGCLLCGCNIASQGGKDTDRVINQYGPIRTPLNKFRTVDAHRGDAHRVRVFVRIALRSSASALERISRPDGLDEFVVVDDAIPVSVEAGNKTVDLLGRKPKGRLLTG